MKRLIACLMILLAGFGASAEEDAAMTVMGESVSFTEAYIYILDAENRYADIADYYKNYLDIDFWSLTYANGASISDMVKADVIKDILMMNVFYHMAKEQCPPLTESERLSCRADAERTYAQLSAANSEHVDLEALAAVFEKQRLADRIYSMLLSELDIDYDAVVSGINKNDYVTYEVEYLFSALNDVFEDNARPLDPEKEKEIRETMQRAACEYSFPEIPEAYPELDIVYGRTSFSSGDERMDPVFLACAESLEKGQCSPVFETGYGLFMIRLTDNSGTAAYDAAVNFALYTAREAAFQDTYERLLSTAEYEINVSFWDSLTPGMS